MVILLATVIVLLVWATRLVQSGVRLREFSLLFAGTLVAMSAIGVVAVYLLMEGCMGYLTHSASSGQFLTPLPPATLTPTLTETAVSAQWGDVVPVSFTLD